MNLNEIETQLYNIYTEIEDNGGELTEELEKQFVITQENFKEKIKSYSKVISEINNDIESISKEKKRLDDYKKHKENVKNRLTNRLIDAIEMFGDKTKSGNSFVDYGTGKTTVRNTASLDVNKQATDMFVYAIANKLKWYIDNNQEDTISLNKKDFVNSFNEFKNLLEEELEISIPDYEFTEDDFDSIKADISFTIPLNNLLNENKLKQFIQTIKLNPIIESKVDKAECKDNIKHNAILSFAKLVNNKSINIK